MADYKLPITKDQFQYLEAYYFRLIHYVESADYKALVSKYKSAVDHEFLYMGIVLDVYTKIFATIRGCEIPVVCWRTEDDKRVDRTVYQFSSIKVAMMALGYKHYRIANISMNDKTGGYKWRIRKDDTQYIFQYRADYEKAQALSFNSNQSTFEFK